MHDLEFWDDSALLEAREHAADTFGVFYRRHVDAVLRECARWRLTATEAADLTAETFAAALLARYRYRSQLGSARAWLLGIARHKRADSDRHWGRESSARKRLGLEVPDLTDLDRGDFVALVDSSGPAEAALRELEPTTQEAVRARVVDGGAYPDVARALGINEAAARQRVSRGLATLRKRLMEGR
jgi:RNA polymerase sigma factor (sigma-70 family)